MLACAALLQRFDPDLYYRSVQEDEALEWSSFWAFLLAAFAAAAAALRQRRVARTLPWFLAGVSAFCLFVAMEEISWGQRLLGFRPPAYFLERNFQQELNVHNVVATRYRKLGLSGAILGYGVVLPLLAGLAPLGRLLRRAAVVPPPRGLAPAFLVTFAAYVAYPWSHMGEWVELMLGLGFLFTALFQAGNIGDAARPAALCGTGALVSAALAVGALGLGTASAWRSLAAVHPESVTAAHVELDALGRDFAEQRLRTRCGLHKRLYSYAEKYDQAALLSGEFARLTAKGLPEARAQFLLDPWNSPYWIRDTCSEDRRRRAVFVYSFGPNRRRDSGGWEIGGDDVGAWIRREGSRGGGDAITLEDAEPDAEP